MHMNPSSARFTPGLLWQINLFNHRGKSQLIILVTSGEMHIPSNTLGSQCLAISPTSSSAVGAADPWVTNHWTENWSGEHPTSCNLSLCDLCYYGPMHLYAALERLRHLNQRMEKTADSSFKLALQANIIWVMFEEHIIIFTMVLVIWLPNLEGFILQTLESSISLSLSLSLCILCRLAVDKHSDTKTIGCFVVWTSLKVDKTWTLWYNDETFRLKPTPTHETVRKRSHELWTPVVCLPSPPLKRDTASARTPSKEHPSP